ncbi:MAG: hypothetical protein ACYTGV_17185 [Planctomycetota bacterium]|jgi:hypothetical protein
MAKNSRRQAPRLGPKALTASPAAKRVAVVLLEVLSGAKGTQEGCETLGISLNRYYQLETRALQGLLEALEPRPKGRQRTAEAKLAEQARETHRLSRELSRHRALLRAAQRSLGLRPPKGRRLEDKPGRAKKGKTKRRRRTTPSRAMKAIAVLREPAPSEPSKARAGARAGGQGDGETAGRIGARRASAGSARGEAPPAGDSGNVARGSQRGRGV